MWSVTTSKSFSGQFIRFRITELQHLWARIGILASSAGMCVHVRIRKVLLGAFQKAPRPLVQL